MRPRHRELNDFGVLLDAALVRIGMTQTEFIAQSGIGTGTLGDLKHIHEKWIRPQDPDIIRSWAHILGMKDAEMVEHFVEVSQLVCSPLYVQALVHRLRAHTR